MIRNYVVVSEVSTVLPLLFAASLTCPRDPSMVLFTKTRSRSASPARQHSEYCLQTHIGFKSRMTKKLSIKVKHCICHTDHC